VNGGRSEGQRNEGKRESSSYGTEENLRGEKEGVRLRTKTNEVGGEEDVYKTGLDRWEGFLENNGLRGTGIWGDKKVNRGGGPLASTWGQLVGAKSFTPKVRKKKILGGGLKGGGKILLGEPLKPKLQKKSRVGGKGEKRQVVNRKSTAGKG